MQGRQSRAAVWAGLSPLAWVVVFEKEDAVGDPVFNYQSIDLFLKADHLNTANTEVVIQDSPDGATWTNRYVLPSAIVPGGESSMAVHCQQKWIRVLVYASAAGRVDGTLAIPEDQVIPGLWPDTHALSCAAYCEISSET